MYRRVLRSMLKLMIFGAIVQSVNGEMTPPEPKAVEVSTGERNGLVLDAVTGKPIEGAAVLYKWDILEPSFEGPSPRPGSRYEVLTDKDGKYTIPSQKLTLEQAPYSKLGKDEVVVYKSGYVSYWFFDKEVRPFIVYLPEAVGTYSPKDNVVRLQPWRNEMSHQEHIDGLMFDLTGDRWSSSLKSLPLFEAATADERALADAERKTTEAALEQGRKEQRKMLKDRDSYKRKEISGDEYVKRLHSYLGITDPQGLGFVSNLLRDCNDTAYMPHLIESMKKNLFSRSFEKPFGGFIYTVKPANDKCPATVPEREEFIKRAEAWWQKNKDTDRSRWDRAAIDQLNPEPKRKGPMKTIDVVSGPELANSPAGVFRKFRAALLAEDVDGALACFTGWKKEQYAKVFPKMKPAFKQMGQDMKVLIVLEEDDDHVKCDLVREENGEMFGYPVEFYRDQNDQWKITEF